MADALRDLFASSDFLPEGIVTAFESPIEAMLFNALSTVLAIEVYVDAVRVRQCGPDSGPVFLPEFYLHSQRQIDRYRIDIALTKGEHVRVAIECDGHDFHERTKVQAARDKARDRALQTAGWLVLRFTGSEVYADPFGCARQALDAADAMESRAIEIEVDADIRSGALVLRPNPVRGQW